MKAYETNYKLYALKKGIEIRKIKLLPFTKEERIYILKEIIKNCYLVIDILEKK